MIDTELIAKQLLAAAELARLRAENERLQLQVEAARAEEAAIRARGNAAHS